MATAFTKIWTGASSSDWNTAGNWSPSGVPADADLVGIFGASAATKQITMASAQNGIQLALLYIDPFFGGSLGNSVNRLQIDPVTLVHRGSGKLWFKTGDSGTTDAIINCNGGSDNFDIDTGGTASITNLRILRGSGALGGSGAIAKIITGFKGNRESDVHLTVATSHGTTTTWLHWGGVVIAAPHTITNLYIEGGEFVKTNTTSATNIFQGGGRLYYESSGTVTLFEGMAGLADFTRNRQAIVTITTLWQYPNLQFIEDPDLVTVTNREIVAA